MTEPTTKHREEARELLPCPFCGVRIIRCGLDQPHWQQWWEHEDRETSKCVLRNQTISDASKVYKTSWNTRALSARDAEIRAVLEGRLAYVESKDLHNGWSGNESGPCCDRCELRPEHFTGRADALKAAAGCRNPFQLPEVCQCHLATRQAVKNGQVSILNQVLALYNRLQPVGESNDDDQ